MKNENNNEKRQAYSPAADEVRSGEASCSPVR